MADLTSQVSIDLNLGVARLGPIEVEIFARGDAVQIAPPFGPMIRSLSFGERSRIVWSAAGSSQPRQSVCRGIVSAATVEAGECDEMTLDVLSLALAGAALDAPSYTESVLLVAKACGWNPDELADMPAGEVDRIAMQLVAPREDSSWNRIVFASGGDSLEGLRDELADNLLSRAAITSSSLLGTDRKQAAAGDHTIASVGVPSLEPGKPQQILGRDVDSIADEFGSLDGGYSPSEGRHERTHDPVVHEDRHTGASDAVEAAFGARAPHGTGRGSDFVDPLPIPGSEYAPAPVTMNSNSVGAPSDGLSIAWDGFSHQPTHVARLDRPSEMHENSTADSVIRSTEMPSVIEGLAAWRLLSNEGMNLSNVGFRAEAASPSRFLLSGDVVMEADAIAALLNQEADLRGIER
jgi:hypothetical protein